MKRALISWCSRCMKPNSNGEDLCNECKKIMAKRKASTTKVNRRYSKRCTKCGNIYYSSTEEGLKEYFHRRNDRLSGLKPNCKICRRIEDKIRYKKVRREYIE